MKKIALFLLVMLAVSSCSLIEPLDSHRLTPYDIIEMSKAGVSDNVIITQIEMTRSVFKLSSEGIIKLKEEGVSDEVIEAMIKTAHAPAYQDWATLMYYDYYGYPYYTPYNRMYGYPGRFWRSYNYYYSPVYPPHYFGGHRAYPSRYFIHRDHIPYWWHYVQPDPYYYDIYQKKPWGGIEEEEENR